MILNLVTQKIRSPESVKKSGLLCHSTVVKSNFLRRNLNSQSILQLHHVPNEWRRSCFEFSNIFWFFPSFPKRLKTQRDNSFYWKPPTKSASFFTVALSSLHFLSEKENWVIYSRRSKKRIKHTLFRKEWINWLVEFTVFEKKSEFFFNFF